MISRLEQMGFMGMVMPVKFGSRAIMRDLYVNLRTEMWVKMRNWLRAGASLPDDPDLEYQLTTLERTYVDDQRIALEKKEKAKERLGGETDFDLADAYACTFAYEIAPRETAGGMLPAQSNIRRDFDPFGEDN